MTFAKRAKKALASAAGVAALCLSAGIFDGTAEAVANGVVAVATVLGVYKVRNVPATGTQNGGPAHV